MVEVALELGYKERVKKRTVRTTLVRAQEEESCRESLMVENASAFYLNRILVAIRTVKPTLKRFQTEMMNMLLVSGGKAILIIK